MSCPKKLIADIGNTNTHIAEFHGSTPIQSISLSNNKLNSDTLTQFFGNPFPNRILVASVNKAGLAALQAAVAPIKPVVFTCRHNKHIKLPPDYKTIGADRIVNLTAAQNAAPQKACIVIDAGTALTVDMVLADGTFAGGYIFPGHNLCFASLNQGTCQLEQFNAATLRPGTEKPGLSTKECIVSGVVSGLNGVTAQLVKTLQKQAPDTVVFVTGGAAKLLSIEPNWLFDPVLTLKGIGLCLS